MRRRELLIGGAMAAMLRLPMPASTAAFPFGVRRGHILCYDSARGELLVFGGLYPASPTGLEPLWAGRRQWWREAGECGPHCRSLVAGAFDTETRVLVVYGGAGPNYSTRYGDLWEWNGTRWREIVASGDWPGPRDHHVMAYDSGRRRVVLYGGSVSLTQSTGIWYTDTWEWDGTTWKRFDVPGPGPRVHHAMAFDPVHKQTILCGGFGQNTPYSGETWGWDGAAWKKLSEEGLPPRARHRMAFHSGSGIVPMEETASMKGLAFSRFPTRKHGTELDGRSRSRRRIVPGRDSCTR